MRLKEVRAILYAHRKFLVNVNRAEEDGVLTSQFVDVDVKKGELFITDQSGNVETMSDEFFEKNYVPVLRVDELAMAKGYMEMGDINLEEANASVHTYNDGLNELEKDEEVISIINKIY